MGKQKEQLDFEVVNERDYIWKTPAQIESVELRESICPHCDSDLAVGYTFIPIGDNKKAKIPGWECRKCRVLFVANSKPIRNLLKDNKNAKAISINGESLWNYSALRKQEKQKEEKFNKIRPKLELLSKVDGGILLVTLKCDSGNFDYIITNSKIKQKHPNVSIIHYSTLLAREIITTIYKSVRNNRFNFEGKEYYIVRPYYPLGVFSINEALSVEIIPSDMRIKSGGGYSTKTMNNQEEIIDVLMFSPVTQRYESVHATYNKSNHKCYMDISIFRSFVKEYGNPRLWLSFGEVSSCKRSFDELRVESILHTYGYSVSDADGLTAAERHSLLAEIVDLEILTIPYIVNMLDFFISTHPSDKYYNARDKWTRDKIFISNYRIDTKRFLVVR